MPGMNEVLGLILGGGAGKRLYPLTRQRSKPAIPIAGKYRLIDIPISNCINSEVQQIAVLTQYNSVSLHRHISTTYTFDQFRGGYVQILAAEQTPSSESWYQGTADAVRKQLFEIRATHANYVLILAGDHLYRMDYEALARYHWENQADITVAVQPVSAGEASRLGILRLKEDGAITDFIEKPKDPAVLERFKSRDDPLKPYMGSMGIYLINTSVLIDALNIREHDDFGSDIIPASIGSRRVFGYVFDGYWEDIGTFRSFYETNLMLAHPDCPFDLYDPSSPIYTHARFLPGSVINGASMKNVLLAEGCHVGSAEIESSVIGLRSQIGNNVRLYRTVLMGADYYDSPENILRDGIPIGIGEGCDLEGAIIDKNARLGPGVIIRPFPRGTEIDRQDYVIRDGIVVIPKSTTIPGGTVIAPE